MSPFAHVLGVEELRALARRRLPRAVFDYIDGGADRERTLAANCRAYDELVFRPRCAVTGPPSIGVTVLGHALSMPVLLAPVGSSRLFYPRGEEVAARAAGEAGTAYILSTLSGCPMEDVRSSGPRFYQLYVVGGREVALGAIARAKAAGYSALVVTIDTPVSGQRERDLRNGIKELLAPALLPRLAHLPQFLARPRWLLGFLRDGGLMRFPNVMLPSGPMPYADVGTMLAQSAVSWADLAWIREAWGGPVIVKGVHTGEDARIALDHGAAAIVVSNHGGRQLDGVHPSVRALVEVVKAVGGRTEILVDGGVRRGSDVVKALCLGARAVLIGRAYAYGLGAGGHAGVARVLELMREEISRTAQLLGCPELARLDRSLVDVPPDWER